MRQTKRLCRRADKKNAALIDRFEGMYAELLNEGAYPTGVIDGLTEERDELDNEIHILDLEVDQLRLRIWSLEILNDQKAAEWLASVDAINDLWTALD